RVRANESDMYGAISLSSSGPSPYNAIKYRRTSCGETPHAENWSPQLVHRADGVRARNSSTDWCEPLPTWISSKKIPSGILTTNTWIAKIIMRFKLASGRAPRTMRTRPPRRMPPALELPLELLRLHTAISQSEQPRRVGQDRSRNRSY